jgi:hypothetical protein
VELHGGSVAVTSAGRNLGAAFTVTLPVAGTQSELRAKRHGSPTSQVS